MVVEDGAAAEPPCAVLLDEIALVPPRRKRPVRAVLADQREEVGRCRRPLAIDPGGDVSSPCAGTPPGRPLRRKPTDEIADRRIVPLNMLIILERQD